MFKIINLTLTILILSTSGCILDRKNKSEIINRCISDIDYTFTKNTIDTEGSFKNTALLVSYANYISNIESKLNHKKFSHCRNLNIPELIKRSYNEIRDKDNISVNQKFVETVQKIEEMKLLSKRQKQIALFMKDEILKKSINKELREFDMSFQSFLSQKFNKIMCNDLEEVLRLDKHLNQSCIYKVYDLKIKSFEKDGIVVNVKNKFFDTLNPKEVFIFTKTKYATEDIVALSFLNFKQIKTLSNKDKVFAFNDVSSDIFNFLEIESNKDYKFINIKDIVIKDVNYEIKE